jgi:hypothetical protein
MLPTFVAAQTQKMTVVDLRGLSSAQRVTALTCSGLVNRNTSARGVYTLLSGDDEKWLANAEGVQHPVLTPADVFVADCIAHVARGVIRFNATAQQAIVPNILTLAAVLDAVPVETVPAGASVAYDTLTSWAGFSALDATRWLYTNHINTTTVTHGCPPTNGPSRAPCSRHVDGPACRLSRCAGPRQGEPRLRRARPQMVDAPAARLTALMGAGRPHCQAAALRAAAPSRSRSL